MVVIKIQGYRRAARAAFLAGSATAAMCLVAPAAAQTEPQAAAAAADAPEDAEADPLPGEIVVTARKRTERLQDVPASVSVLNTENLSRQGVVRFEDYAARVPGLSLTSARTGLTQVTLRGITTGPTQSASATAFYIDEAPVGSANAYTAGSSVTPDLDPSDLSQIEVLKGPQGTLYGAGSMGGLVKFVTAAPDFNDISGRASAGISSVDSGGTGYSFRAALNVPIVEDRLVLRASGFKRKDAGFIDNVTSPAAGKDVNDARVDGARVLLAARLGENVQVSLQAIGQETKVGGSNAVDVDATTLEPLFGDLQQRRFTREPGRIKLQLYNATVRVDLGAIDLVSSTTYQIIGQHTEGDGSLGFGAALGGLGIRSIQDTRTERWAQEFRANATGIAGGLLDLQVGLYYTDEKGSNRIPRFDVFSRTTGAAIPFPNIITAAILSTYEEYSAFANATVHFNDRFDVLVGGRFSHDNQTYFQDYRGLIIPGGTLIINSDEKADVFTYLVTPRYRLSDDAIVYGRVASGYRPGGPNAVPPATIGAPQTFDPDKLTSYELGSKFSVGRVLTIDAAAFYTDWKDIQIQTSSGGFNFFVNGGSAVSKGAEVTARLTPVRGLTLGVNAAYTDARLSSDAPAAGGVDGNRLPFVPRWSGSLLAQYERAFAGDWRGSLSAVLNHTGERASNYQNRERRSVDDFTTLNLSAGAEYRGLSLSVFAKNVTDERGILSLASPFLAAPSSRFSAGVIQPRTLGAEIAYRF